MGSGYDPTPISGICSEEYCGQMGPEEQYQAYIRCHCKT